MNDLVMWMFVIPSFGSIITIFSGVWFVRKDVKKRTRWVTYSSLFFSFVFFVSLASIILTSLISITKDFEIFLMFIMFGITYLALFLKGRLKYSENFD